MKYFVSCMVTLPHNITCEISNGAFMNFDFAVKSYKSMSLLCNFLVDEGAIIRYDLSLEEVTHGDN